MTHTTVETKRPRNVTAACQNVPVGVWLVTGVQAAGKSTVADLLARQFDRGVHVRGGQFYRWAVRGWVHPGDEREAEARRLLDLRYRLSATVADEYCQGTGGRRPVAGRPGASSLSMMTTVPPSAASRSAMPRPTPRPPPVTT